MDEILNRHFYRETVRGSGIGVGKIIRQRGPIHQYAHVQVSVQAMDRGRGILLDWNAGLGVDPRFVSAVIQGVEMALGAGELAGLAFTDIRMTIEDGSYHDIDSTAILFEEAAEMATREAIREAKPQILEALILVSVAGPGDLLGTITKTVSVRGATIAERPPETPSHIISCRLPVSRTPDLIAELLKITGGRVNISTMIDGFQLKDKPPDTSEPWIGRR
jgi:elongation factor G